TVGAGDDVQRVPRHVKDLRARTRLQEARHLRRQREQLGDIPIRLVNDQASTPKLIQPCKVAIRGISHGRVDARNEILFCEREEEPINEETVEVAEHYAYVVGLHRGKAGLVHLVCVELGRTELLQNRQEGSQQLLQNERRIEHEKQLHTGPKPFFRQEPL